MQVASPSDEVRIGAEGLQPGDGPHELMRGSVPAMPMAFQADLFARVDHGDDDPLQQEPDDRLALLLGRGLGSPEGGQIVGQILDGGVRATSRFSGSTLA